MRLRHVCQADALPTKAHREQQSSTAWSYRATEKVLSRQGMPIKTGRPHHVLALTRQERQHVSPRAVRGRSAIRLGRFVLHEAATQPHRGIAQGGELHHRPPSSRSHTKVRKHTHASPHTTAQHLKDNHHTHAHAYIGTHTLSHSKRTTTGQKGSGSTSTSATRAEV